MHNNNLFQILRQQTGPAHRALEATYPFSQHMRSEHFSAETYARSLHVLKAFHHAASPAVAGLPPTVTQFIDVKSVLEALELDLAALPPVTGEQPVFNKVSEPVSAEVAVAFSYVWMGSSMGGTIIRRWLKKHYPALPVNYYHTMASSGDKWDQYKTAVQTFSEAGHIDEHRCGVAAVAVFDGIMQAASCYRAAESAAD